MNVTPQRPAYASATCETHRNSGPRGRHGCVTLEFERAPEFRFQSVVKWPAADNYDSVVEQAVRETLATLQKDTAFQCRLTAIRWHELDSCASEFALAAAHATRLAFGVL